MDTHIDQKVERPRPASKPSKLTIGTVVAGIIFLVLASIVRKHTLEFVATGLALFVVALAQMKMQRIRTRNENGNLCP